ncbi:MAG: glycosyltransferase family 2 protein [Candidatus Eiseniibacteriota bacterium]
MITIGIPVFNRETLVRHALESALRQPEQDLEILVVDNASTDGTWAVLNGYRDPRLRLVRNDRNLGLFGNFNRCIFLARGRYVLTLCSDDELVDGFLGPARALLDADPSLAIVSSRGRATDAVLKRSFPLGSSLPAGVYEREDGVVAALWALSVYYQNPFNYPSGILVRAARARECGGMDERLSYASDVKLYLAMIEEARLAIVDRRGCEVLVHLGAEQHNARSDPARVTEFTHLFDPYESLLERRGLAAGIREHVAGYLIGSSIKHGLAGRSGFAGAFRAEFRRRSPGWVGALAALADSVRRRAILARGGPASSPVPVRVQPLPALPPLPPPG